MELICSQTIITAMGFCPKCEAKKHATRGTKFVMYDNNGWHDMAATKKSYAWGFVPHIYKLERVLQDGTVCASFSCAVKGCGSNWKKMKDISYIATKKGNYNIWHLEIAKENYQPIVLSAKSWNYLVMNPYNLDFEADFLH